jgi:hypothetical protein
MSGWGGTHREEEQRRGGISQGPRQHYLIA